MAEGPEAEARTRGALDELLARGVVARDGSAGAAATWLVAGGFSRVRLDHREHEALWGNQQGGFQVRCPREGIGVARALGANPSADDRVACPGCGADHAVRDLVFRPPVAFGRSALVVTDTGDAELAPEARQWADRALGPWKLVWRRVG